MSTDTLDRLRKWIAAQPMNGASGGGNHTGLDLFAKTLDETEARHAADRERLRELALKEAASRLDSVAREARRRHAQEHDRTFEIQALRAEADARLVRELQASPSSRAIHWTAIETELRRLREGALNGQAFGLTEDRASGRLDVIRHLECVFGVDLDAGPERRERTRPKRHPDVANETCTLSDDDAPEGGAAAARLVGVTDHPDTWGTAEDAQAFRDGKSLVWDEPAPSSITIAGKTYPASQVYSEPEPPPKPEDECPGCDAKADAPPTQHRFSCSVHGKRQVTLPAVENRSWCTCDSDVASCAVHGR
jgi:hypothetical protein